MEEYNVRAPESWTFSHLRTLSRPINIQKRGLQETRLGTICLLWSDTRIYKKSRGNGRWDIHVALALLEPRARIQDPWPSMWWLLAASLTRPGTRGSLRVSQKWRLQGGETPLRFGWSAYRRSCYLHIGFLRAIAQSWEPFQEYTFCFSASIFPAVSALQSVGWWWQAIFNTEFSGKSLLRVWSEGLMALGNLLVCNVSSVLCLFPFPFQLYGHISVAIYVILI